MRVGASPLFSAISIADSASPEALAIFDRIAAGSAPRPDFYEHSTRFGAALEPHRLTYYFDMGRADAERARIAGERFVALAEALALSLPPALVRLVQREIPGRDEVLQVVLGIEAPADESAIRAKYYLVFRDAPGALVTRALDALGVEAPPPAADPAKVYILGLDIGRAGLLDCKLYFRLDLALLPRVVENLGEIRDLIAGTREVVFQHCLQRPERRQIYLHATHAGVIAPWLERRQRDVPAIATLLDRQEAINAALAGDRIDPWIIAFAYRDHRVALEAGNVYFHLETG